MKTTIILWLLLILMIILSYVGRAKFIDDFPVSHWLEQVGEIETLIDPNVPLEVNGIRYKKLKLLNADKRYHLKSNHKIVMIEPDIFDLEKFCWYARVYSGDPNTILLLKWLEDPNDPNILK